MRFRAVLSAAGMLAFLFSGCLEPSGCVEPEDPPYDCVCTAEYRMNVCVTVNGSSGLPDSLRFLREYQDGTRDSLNSFMGNHCFGELPGTQRILMLRNSVTVDSTGWFALDTVDCCHGEDTTVNFVK
jgi:hypothetical protein